MAGIVLEFSHHGDFDNFGIIRSSTPTNLTSLPSPLVTGLSTMFYVDTAVVDGETYYYRAVVWRDGKMEVSEEFIATATAGDPYWDKVVVLLHMNGNLTDECGNSWVAEGGMQLSYTDPKFGSSCAYSDGSYNSNLHMTSPTPKLLNDDFCIEMFYKPVNTNTWYSFFNTYGAGNTAERNLAINNSNGKLTASLITITGNNDFILNEWHHVAYTRQGGVLRLFLDGILVGSGAITESVRTDAIYIGLQPYSAVWAVPGHYDELRITKGIARYTENFTSPKQAFLDR